MEVKKDIGKAFKEKLEGLDRQPGDALWNSISTELDKKKKRKFPLFWFSVCTCTLLALMCVAYIVTNFSSDSNAVGTKHDTLQNNTTVNSAVTTSENASENNDTFKDSSANTKTANPPTNAGNATLTKATVTSSKGSGYLKNNTKKGSKTVDSVIKTNASSKNNGQKNNAVAGTNRKHKIVHHEGIASAGNSKTGKKANKFKKHPTALYSSKNNTAVAPVNDYTEPGLAGTTSKFKRNSQKTARQSQSNEQTTGYESEKQTGNASGRTVTTSSAINGSETVTREGMPLTTNDSLPENTLVVKDSLKTEAPKEEIAEEKEKTKKDSLAPVVVKRFSVFTYGGPSSFNFPERTIVTDSTSSNITTKSATRFGVLFGYRLNSKLSIRTGISFYKLKQSSSHIKLNYVMGGDAVNPELIPTADFNWIDYKQPFGTNSGQIISNLGENYQAIINIDRDLSYLEIPLEIGYTLFDRKFGLDIFAGGSMLILNKNKVSAYNENGRMYLGKWNAATKTSFTGTLGLRLHYNFSPSLQLNAEPILNYYLNTYKDSKPYSFTVRLGLQYNFDIGQKKK